MTTYSPSASTSEGKAPISSRMTSPPGVSTVKVGISKRLAGGLVDQLERERRAAVTNCDIDPLA